MREARTLVDPRMATSHADFYPNRVTIRRPVRTRNSVGEEGVGLDPSVLAGHVDLRARIERDRGVTDAELRDPERTLVAERFRIAFAGYLPAIRLTDQAVDELGRVFNLVRVDHSEGVFTTLVGEVVD